MTNHGERLQSSNIIAAKAHQHQNTNLIEATPREMEQHTMQNISEIGIKGSTLSCSQGKIRQCFSIEPQIIAFTCLFCGFI